MEKENIIIYNKLVRDRIIEIIKQNGERVESHVIKDDKDYLSCLILKLQEEGNEVLLAETKEAKTEELADLLEVVFAIGSLLQLEEQELLCLGKSKSLAVEGIYKTFKNYLDLLHPNYITTASLVVFMRYIYAIACLENIEIQDINTQRNAKKIAKGGFSKRLFLERTEKVTI